MVRWTGGDLVTPGEKYAEFLVVPEFPNREILGFQPRIKNPRVVSPLRRVDHVYSSTMQLFTRPLISIIFFQLRALRI